MRVRAMRSGGIVLAAVLLLGLACSIPIGPKPVPPTMPPTPEFVQASTATPVPAKITATPPPAATPTRVVKPSATEAPSPEPRDEPARTPTLSGELAISDLNTVLPEDAVREMMTFGGGGGPGRCLQPSEPIWDRTVGRPEPLPYVLWFKVCWGGPEDSVYFEVVDPDGNRDGTLLPVQEERGQRFIEGFYQIDITRPAGRYDYSVQGVARMEGSVIVEPARLPVIYQAYSSPFRAEYGMFGPRHRLRLAGFAPGERLRLWIYRVSPQISLLGWQDARVDARGEAWIDLDLPVDADTWISAGVSGPVSGEVHVVQLLGWQMIDPLPQPILCSGAQPSRLVGAAFARVLADTPFFYQGNPEMPQEQGVTAGEVVRLARGPFCLERMWWWQVEKPDGGTAGLLPEMNGGQVVLEAAE